MEEGGGGSVGIHISVSPVIGSIGSIVSGTSVNFLYYLFLPKGVGRGGWWSGVDSSGEINLRRSRREGGGKRGRGVSEEEQGS